MKTASETVFVINFNQTRNTMFDNKPLFNVGPVGFATDLNNNQVGSFDSFGNFRGTLDQYSTAKVDAFGYLRDNVANNMVAKVQGPLPQRTDLYTHKPNDYNDSFELPGLNLNKPYDFKNSFELPELNSYKSYDFNDSFELPTCKLKNLYDI